MGLFDDSGQDDFRLRPLKNAEGIPIKPVGSESGDPSGRLARAIVEAGFIDKPDDDESGEKFPQTVEVRFSRGDWSRKVVHSKEELERIESKVDSQGGEIRYVNEAVSAGRDRVELVILADIEHGMSNPEVERLVSEALEKTSSAVSIVHVRVRK